MNARCFARKNIQINKGTPRRIQFLRFLTAFLLVLVAASLTHAGITASISGTVTDSSGAAIVGATVTATNVETGVAETQQTNAQGFYSFQSLPLGKYTVEVAQKGFKGYRQTGLVLEVNQALVVDVSLQVGQTTETVEVSSAALHVDTANTQMGEVIEGKEMTDVPLVTRSYTDLLALQPGVVSSSSGMNGALGGSFTSAGFSPPLVSGSENAGALSVNGMREAANGFILNGILVQETGFSGAGAIPNLDSIAEFRILTNNFDAEYGNYSGGQINVVTKSGTNDWHGNAFEFLRNTDFDAANFFAAGERGSYHQNQFGGTFGGPIKRDKIFFFADYQGNRLIQAVTQVVPGAPSEATEEGNLSGIASSLIGTTVNGAAWASQLSQQLGQIVTKGEPYYFTGCTSYSQCVLPNALLPTTDFSPISSKLLQYILPANGPIGANGTGNYSTSAGKINLDDNKFSGRVDANSGLGLLSAYYYYDKFNRIDPYWQGNAPLYPGFSVDSNGQTDNINLGDTKTFGSAAVNEFRLGYFRLDTKFNQPQGGLGVSLASLGFATAANRGPGVYVGTPSVEGVPEIDFNNFVIGVPSRPNQLVENIYQVLDNYSKVIGTHTVKLGGQFHFNTNEENLSNVANGNFFFGSNFGDSQPSETGSDFVDFLLGAPSSYVQGQSYPSYGRNFYFGAYVQDSWRIKSNLTFNYGFRYDVSEPWHEKFNEIQTLIPGLQSVVFPGSPNGWVFPGDPGVPRTLAPTRWDNFAPRFGLAYSFGSHEGMLGKILGKPGTTSIRAGWGMFYTSFEGATDYNEIGDAPFGNYTGQNESTFAAPFTNRAAGTSISNLFPVPAPVKGFSPSNPATCNFPVGPEGCPFTNLSAFFSAYGTIGSSPAFYNKNVLPYAENYELSVQRELTTTDLLTVSYVGTQAHHLLSSESANPGNPALCLSLHSEGCGPGNENNIYIRPNGTYALGTRTPFSGVALPPTPTNTPLIGNGGTLLPDGNIGIIPFGNDSYFITGAYSSYNSAQINWRHTSHRLQTLVGYTFSKSLDNSSGYGEQYNPINPRLSRGLSAFDCTNNFVASYAYTLPIDKLDGPKKLTNGWQISGITRFATGLPVTVIETDDRSLLGTSFGGPIILPVDTPNLLSSVQLMNPRNNPNHYFFTTSSFGADNLGQEGTANRRSFHGPGINNWDFALLKNTQLTERLNLQFRAELFNVFNHAQFITPSGLVSFSCTNVTETSTCTQNAGSFGEVTQAQQPRIGQLSLKLNF